MDTSAAKGDWDGCAPQTGVVIRVMRRLAVHVVAPQFKGVVLDRYPMGRSALAIHLIVRAGLDWLRNGTLLAVLILITMFVGTGDALCFGLRTQIAGSFRPTILLVQDSCPNSDYPVACSNRCYPPGSICCGDHACKPGAVCVMGACCAWPGPRGDECPFGSCAFCPAAKPACVGHEGTNYECCTRDAVKCQVGRRVWCCPSGQLCGSGAANDDSRR